MNVDPDISCCATIRLTRREYRYVAKIPGMQMWWENCYIKADHLADRCRFGEQRHYERCCMPADKYEVRCVLAVGHDGDHAALVGVLPEDVALEPYIFWRAGVPGAREIRQPGTCLIDPSPDAEDGACCQLFDNHPGPCLLV